MTIVPPIYLSQSEYEKVWQPGGWELLSLSTRETYRSNWGMWEAIRDIVQNALDETEAYTYGSDDEGTWIADTGTGVSVRDFLYGEAKDKKKPEWARGQFGEGMKIAILTFLREGYQTRICTSNKEIWAVFYPQKVGVRDYENVLHCMWRPFRGRRGTEVKMFGYFGTTYPERFVVNFPKEDILVKVASPLTEPVYRFNTLLSPQLAHGKKAHRLSNESLEVYADTAIYARDVYMKEIRSMWSYNLWGFQIAPDRHDAANQDDIYRDITRVWCGVTDVALLKQLLWLLEADKRWGEEPIEQHMMWWGLGNDPLRKQLYDISLVQNQASWRKAWTEAFGDHVVLETSDQYNNWVTHLNYGSVKLKGDAGYYLGTRYNILRTDADLVADSQESLSKSEKVPDSKLPPHALANLNLVRAIADFFGISRVEAAIIPPASDNARTAGLYEFTTNTIKIHVNQLNKFSDTIDTAIHEIAHHVAYLRAGRGEAGMAASEDLSPGHSDALSSVGATIVRDIHRWDDCLLKCIIES